MRIHLPFAALISLAACRAFGIVCDDGTVPGPVHIQFAHFLDTAAFEDNDCTKVRYDLANLPGRLADEFGTLTEYKQYYFNDKERLGVFGCGWEPSQGFYKLADFGLVLGDVAGSLGVSAYRERKGRYNSISDAIYFSVGYKNSGWIRSKLDENGVPVMRFLLAMTNIEAWTDDYYTSLGTWPLNLDNEELPNCIRYNIPSKESHLKPTIAVFPSDGTYFLFLARDVDGTTTISDWYRNEYMTNHLGGVKGWSEKLSSDLLHAEHSVELVRRGVCDYWSKLAPPPTGYTCENGANPGPVHIQFAHFVDVAAFQDDTKRWNYREDMFQVPRSLALVFGNKTEYKLTYFNDKDSQCNAYISNDAFLSIREFYKLEESWNSLFHGNDRLPRSREYSSLSDALFYSLTTPTINWVKSPKDVDNVPVLRIISVGTDVATWTSQSDPTKTQWPNELGGDVRPEDCAWHDYPSIEGNLHSAVTYFPSDGTYFIFLSETQQPQSGPLSVVNVATWYGEFFMTYHLMGAKGAAEEMQADLRHVDRVVSLVIGMACDLMLSQ